MSRKKVGASRVSGALRHVPRVSHCLRADCSRHAINFLRAIRRLDNANSVTACEVFLAKPRNDLRQAELALKHPFRVTKRQFGFVKVRYRGLKKNTAQLTTLFGLSNLRMARGKLMGTEA